MLCNTTIIRHLNKPTQSKTQLTQGVVNSFNTYYTLKKSNRVQENLYLIVTNPFYHARKRQLINWLLHELAVRKLNYLFYETHADLSKNQHYFSEQLPRCCKIVVLGGDGTLHLAVNAMAGSDVSLALVPCGTGNDFARGLGWSLAEALLVNALL